MSLETMTKISTVTVGAGGVSTVTFSNIPQSYTDLVVKASARTDRALENDEISVRINGDTSAIYSYRSLTGNGSSASSPTETNTTRFRNLNDITGANATSSTFGNTEFYIPNYASASFKSISFDSTGENNATLSLISASAGLFGSTSAVTSIVMFPRVGPNFVQHSTFTLYGIKNARQTAGNSIKATGGIISFDGTYVYHTFNSSGTFTPISPLTASSLVIAGGGAGGGTSAGGGDGGGGGAGGLSYLEYSYFAPNTIYAVTIGAGGSGQTSTRGNNGSDSMFNGITSVGGGGGGGNGASGNSGGSGGGGGANNAAGGAATQGNSGGATGYGNAGGSSITWAYNISGGGGAGGVGVGGNASVNTPTVAPNGGIGLNTWASWLGKPSELGYLAGGGAGGKDSTVSGAAGIGGLGGGGNGGVGTGAVLPTRGSANTGGGGGGGGGNLSQDGAAGGSGIVIIRYKG
jgi:hypothetical protein